MKNGLALLLFLLAALQNLKAGDFPLITTIPAGQNYVQLSWDPSGLPYYDIGRYYYTINISDNNGAQWQTCSANYGKSISVLNVYPDIAGSNQLLSWMGTKTTDPGMGLINVTEVTITSFNANPDSWLKDAAGKYKYDVIMFGSWDSNNDKDLNAISAAAVRSFLNSGRGVLFGHDAQSTPHPYFSSLKDKTDLDIDPNDDRKNLWRGGDVTRVINNGFLLKYPHTISYNTNLSIPYTHSRGQTAKGIVWMNFPVASGQWTSPPQTVNGGTNDFYLTTNKNAAMIQTGHSKGQATTDEQNIIANTLIYLAQYTQSTAAETHCAMDTKAPDAPVAVGRTSCNSFTFISKDNGSDYLFFVTATDTTDHPYYSDTVSATIKTGLAKFVINEYTASGAPVVPTETVAAADSEPVTCTFHSNASYIHVQAVDSAGNLSAVCTVPLTRDSTFNESICQGSSYEYNNQYYSKQGTYSVDTIPSKFGCDSVYIYLKLTVIPVKNDTIYDAICQNELYNRNGFPLSDDPADVILTDVPGTLFPYPFRVSGCDTTTLILTVHPTYLTPASQTIDTVNIFSDETYKGHNQDFIDTTLKTVCGCDSAAFVHLRVTYVPNTFTPNGDGINDIFLPNHHVQVFTRNGLLVYDGTNGWDGTYRGKPVRNDTYFYILYYQSVNGIKTRNGYVVVDR